MTLAPVFAILEVPTNPGVRIMTPDERKLLTETTKELFRLYQERDDMIVGFTAVVLDLYRIDFRSGSQTKGEALLRLRAQRDYLDQHSPKKMGVRMLNSLIETLETDKLDAAKLIRDPAVGSA